MNKCELYDKKTGVKPVRCFITGMPAFFHYDIAVCKGTKELDECTCGGDRIKCDFYLNVREAAKKELTLEKAISHFKHGISHDIFSEPVTSYAKMAVEALEKQKLKAVDNDELVCISKEDYKKLLEYKQMYEGLCR